MKLFLGFFCVFIGIIVLLIFLYEIVLFDFFLELLFVLGMVFCFFLIELWDFERFWDNVGLFLIFKIWIVVEKVKFMLNLVILSGFLIILFLLGDE